jgi:hypothetical protein
VTTIVVTVSYTMHGTVKKEKAVESTTARKISESLAGRFDARDAKLTHSARSVCSETSIAHG